MQITNSLTGNFGKRRNIFARFFRALNKHKYLYILILPGILYLIIFRYVPMYGIVIAFQKFQYKAGMFGSPWVGFDNFKLVLKYPEFWGSFKNTVIISLGKFVIGFPAPLVLALLLNELRSIKYKKIIQSIMYMPHFFSWIIIYGIFFSLFSTTSGAISRILVQNGITPPVLLGNPKTFRMVIYLTDVWKGAGWGTIIYLAALSGINPELYEAAIIDGANRFKQMLYITLPSLKFAIVILVILSLGGTMQAGFDQIFNFYDPTVYAVGDIIDTYVYRIGIINGRFEVGTAIGLFQSVINCVLLILADRVAKLLGQEGLF